MLDANARHLPKGLKFFVSGRVGDELQKLGLRNGQYALCKMLDDSDLSPRFSIKIDKKVYTFKYGEDIDFETFLVYQGLPNGEDFLCDKAKSACEELIGGFNSRWNRY